MSTKTLSNKKSCKKITENFRKKILDMVNQNVQNALKKFQDTKNKEYKKIQKQINEFWNTKVKQRTLKIER
jgi:hypothetical protein